MPNVPRPTLRRRSAVERSVVEVVPVSERIEVTEAAGLRWVNVERPTPSDQVWLEAEYGFHPLDFEDVFSRNQRPKLDAYDEYLFIVLQFPSFDKATGRLSAAEVDLFVGRTS
jgi:magnesium transporter